MALVGPSEQPPGPQVLRLGLGGLKPPPSLHGVPTLTLLWPGASLERGKLRPREGPRQKYPDSQATICTPGPAAPALSEVGEQVGSGEHRHP